MLNRFIFCLFSVIMFGLRFAFFTHISERKNAHFQNMCAKKRNDFRQLKRSNFRVEKRRIYQSSWTTWPIGLWLIWGIVLWKEINHVRSRVKNIAWQKTLFSQKNPLFSPKKNIVFQHVHFLSHCFETKHYHCLFLRLSQTLN